MIFGEYPCCGGLLQIPMPEKSGVFWPENCPHCSAKVWHLLSRVCPQSWTEEAFFEEFEIDEATRKINRKGEKDGPAADPHPDITELLNKLLAQQMLEQMATGSWSGSDEMLKDVNHVRGALGLPPWDGMPAPIAVTLPAMTMVNNRLEVVPCPIRAELACRWRDILGGYDG